MGGSLRVQPWGDCEPPEYFADFSLLRGWSGCGRLTGEILLIAIAAISIGANGWNDIEGPVRSLHARVRRMSGFLPLPGGLRLARHLQPGLSRGSTRRTLDKRASCVRLGDVDCHGLSTGEVVAIDGKSLRDTRCPANKSIAQSFRWASI